KPFACGHPFIESIANCFLNGNIPVIDNTSAFIEAHRWELYERYSLFSKLLNLFHISWSKKIATASSMLAPTGLAEDVSTKFPPS
ncbi:hypothetical protein Godav_009938, partial [Gossypium davidsonii]|nr:hypothetical protein [Gossypium davidsonii]MBA0660205.1 hypothetical protein [Gossypium klotzschianum]